MRVGHIDVFTHSTVGGWVADTESPDEPLDVDIVINDERIVRITANNPRPDLASLKEYGAGFHGFNVEFEKPLDPTLTHLLAIRFAGDGSLLVGSERVLKKAWQSQVNKKPTVFTPILVTGPGRSGTTLVMALLANSPEIVAAELMPYEIRLLAYYANAHHVLTHQADMLHSTHADELQGDGYYIGFNPYNSQENAAAFTDADIAKDYADQFVPERLGMCFRELITEYYVRLAFDQGKSGVRFFAEKNNNLQALVRDFSRQRFGKVREIVTIRDPRDILCSHKAYFKSDLEQSFVELTEATVFLHELRSKGAGDIYFNTYETLLQAEPKALESLSAFLGTQITGLPKDLSGSNFARHATSSALDATIGRWRRELSSEWHARCLKAWRPFLETFDYPLF